MEGNDRYITLTLLVYYKYVVKKEYKWKEKLRQQTSQVWVSYSDVSKSIEVKMVWSHG
jgi:hypothetical protein